MNQTIQNNSLEEKFAKISHEVDAMKTRLNKPTSRPMSSKDASQYILSDNESKYNEAFDKYLRSGSSDKLDDLSLEYKSYFKNNANNDIGYSVTNKMNQSIYNGINEMCPMRNISSVMQVSTDSVEIIDQKEKIIAGWSDSAIKETESSNAMSFAKQIISINDLYAQPKITQRLLDDPRLNASEWLSNELTEIFQRKENEAFINGDGVNKPRGILTQASEIETVVNDSPAHITLESLKKLYYSLDDVYVRNAKFLMHRSVAESISRIRDNNSFIWKGNIGDSDKNTLFGLEIVLTSDMPKLSQGNIVIALADFNKCYQIIDNGGINVLRDPYTQKPFVKFYSHKKTGGDVVNHDAIKFLKMPSK